MARVRKASGGGFSRATAPSAEGRILRGAIFRQLTKYFTFVASSLSVLTDDTERDIVVSDGVPPRGLDPTTAINFAEGGTPSFIL